MEQTLNLNVNSQNFGQCIKTVSNWGDTIYQNICNGASAHVPWGGVDWFTTIGLLTFATTMILLFTSLGISMYRIGRDCY